MEISVIEQAALFRLYGSLDYTDIYTPPTRIVALYADGGVIDTNPSPIGGVYAFCGVDKNDERIFCGRGFVPSTPSKLITNNHTEQIAICLALEAMPDGWSGDIYSDSTVALNRVFKIGKCTYKNLPDNLIRRTETAFDRMGKLTKRHLKGHPTEEDLARGYAISKRSGKQYPVSKHNVWCDEMCGVVANIIKSRGVDGK